MQRVGSTETAFMGARLLSSSALMPSGMTRNKRMTVLAYSRAYLAEMEPYSPGGLYVNFAGLGEEGEKLVKEAYGANYQRLVGFEKQVRSHKLVPSQPEYQT